MLARCFQAGLDGGEHGGTIRAEVGAASGGVGHPVGPGGAVDESGSTAAHALSCGA